jgi:hypothetical protein
VWELAGRLVDHRPCQMFPTLLCLLPGTRYLAAGDFPRIGEAIGEKSCRGRSIAHPDTRCFGISR